MTACKASISPADWEGTWLYERYAGARGGCLKISNCRNNKCNFNIATYNGAHVCDVDGEMTIDGVNAVFSETLRIYSDEPSITGVIKMTLLPEKRIIKVTDEENASGMHCGMQGHLDGQYEHEDNPLRYPTSFNCWDSGLTDSQKEICADAGLSQADLEFDKNFKESKTEDWYKQRESCGVDKKCLWMFYTRSIRAAYEKKAGYPLNFYEYMGKLDENALFYPTDFTLLTDFLRKNMPPKDYDAWSVSLANIAMNNNECKDCYYHSYGVAGLYTIYESAFYINKDEIWLAFISANVEEDDKDYIIVYAPENKTQKDIPAKYNDWLERIREYYLKGIKLKHFKEN